VPYRWESQVRDYREAQLTEVTFEDLHVVVLNRTLLHDGNVSGADKAAVAKVAAGINEGLLMEGLGRKGKAALVRETESEWELLVPHCLLPHLKFQERVVTRWRRHTHMCGFSTLSFFLFFVANKNRRLSTVDLSARITMKNAANCDT